MNIYSLKLTFHPLSILQIQQARVNFNRSSNKNKSMNDDFSIHFISLMGIRSKWFQTQKEEKKTSNVANILMHAPVN